MDRRLPLVALLLVLAGCGQLGTGGRTPGATVTPAPTPVGGDDLPEWADQPGTVSGDPTVNGTALLRTHRTTLAGNFERSIHLEIGTGSRTPLRYRSNRTLAAEFMVVTRRYRGPETDRFVFGVDDATSARERLYFGERAEENEYEQVVDGEVRTDGDTTPHDLDPAVRAAPGFIATLLDGARLSRAGQSETYAARTVYEEAPPGTTPGYLNGTTDVTVRATILEDGRLERLHLAYTATLDGRRVRVVQTVRWRSVWADEPTPSFVDE